MSTLCIHGLVWQTCGFCYQKSENDVLADLNRQKEEQSNELIYDYQGVASTSEVDDDRAYDLDDSGM